MALKPLDIVALEKKAGNIYEAIVITAKRARQINDEQKIEYNQRLQPIIEKEEEDETVVSKDKMNISLDFEKRRKATDVALDDLMNNDIEFRSRTEETE
ncbi:MAG: DNA-directed RNA polymerase subunit omega [Ignavibacteria bacterium]|jgi:DNA-directed RNA polymerase subunit K/omega